MYVYENNLWQDSQCLGLLPSWKTELDHDPERLKEPIERNNGMLLSCLISLLSSALAKSCWWFGVLIIWNVNQLTYTITDKRFYISM